MSFVHRFINFFTSLRLTVVCLALAIILVFGGTLAEASLGLYVVQSQFFRSFIVFWTSAGSHLKIPIFPGGWLIGLVLLVNLLAAHIKRFQFSRKKIGILLVHAGLIFLLVGQFTTEIFQVESQMVLRPGQTRNYTEATRKNELVVIDVSDPNFDSVAAIPESLVAKGGEIQPPGFPFKLLVKKYSLNSMFSGPMMKGEKINSSEGVGKMLPFTAESETTEMDDVDKPMALVEVVTGDKSLGDWIVSTWLTQYPFAETLQSRIGSILGPNVQVTAPQTFDVAGHTYQIAFRPVRYYKPYAITLLEFKHGLYAGTDIPSNFSSKVHLKDSSRGEDRDVLIYMNNPLRYDGETFYQAGFLPGDEGTILQVVRNPASITPYVACCTVALGLIIQFVSHLVGFARKRLQPVKVPAPKTGRRWTPAETLAAAKRGDA